MHVERFTIAERFRGPPKSGNGGYVCGRIARQLQGTVAVRLKAAPPLGAVLRLESTAQHARLLHGTSLIGEGRSAHLELAPPPSPSYEEAQAAAKSFSGFSTHAFPGCFVCGTARKPLDGLRIFPGALAGTSTLAAPWRPDPSLTDASGRVSPEFLWAALDCTGGFAVSPLPEGTVVVLGELCASIAGEVRTDEPCVVIGWPLSIEGRKRNAGSAVYADGGRLVALARAVWIEVAPRAWS